MRKFISRAMVFCLILYVTLVIVDYAYSGLIRKSNYTPVEAWTDIVDGTIQADVIALGSSRTLVQVDPMILDSVLCSCSYNLGYNGSPINRQVKKYNIYRRRNAKPKLIIQNIDAWSLGYRIGYEKEQFFPFFWKKDIRNKFFSSEPFTFGEKYIPLYRYHGLNLQMFTRSMPRSLNKGYLAHNEKWDGTNYLNQDSIEFIVNDTTYHMFDSFLQSVTEDSIMVVFVYSPLYFGATKKIRNIDEMYAIYKSLADKYSIPILDYSDLWICNDTTYFYNAMHLNKSGAEIYTDSLANDIKRLGLY